MEEPKTPRIQRMTTFEALQQKKASIAVVGLGYVGLPLAVAFARQFNVIGFEHKPRAGEGAGRRA